MSKKIAKLFLFLTTVGAAFAGAYYFMKSKDKATTEEDDYADLDDDSFEIMDDDSSERSYVSLNPDAGRETDGKSPDSDEKNDDSDEKSGTTIEEFFDDDDDNDNSMDAI